MYFINTAEGGLLHISVQTTSLFPLIPNPTYTTFISLVFKNHPLN